MLTTELLALFDNLQTCMCSRFTYCCLGTNVFIRHRAWDFNSRSTFSAFSPPHSSIFLSEIVAKDFVFSLALCINFSPFLPFVHLYYNNNAKLYIVVCQPPEPRHFSLRSAISTKVCPLEFTLAKGYWPSPELSLFQLRDIGNATKIPQIIFKITPLGCLRHWSPIKIEVVSRRLLYLLKHWCDRRWKKLQQVGGSLQLCHLEG